MKVYGYTKDKQGIMEIENSLKAEQAFVGGLIECTALTEEIDLICNEEGWLIGLEPRVAIPESETIIAGDCFICRKIYVSFKIYLKSRQIFFICPR